MTPGPPGQVSWEQGGGAVREVLQEVCLSVCLRWASEGGTVLLVAGTAWAKAWDEGNRKQL